MWEEYIDQSTYCWLKSAQETNFVEISRGYWKKKEKSHDKTTINDDHDYCGDNDSDDCDDVQSDNDSDDCDDGQSDNDSDDCDDGQSDNDSDDCDDVQSDNDSDDGDDR